MKSHQQGLSVKKVPCSKLSQSSVDLCGLLPLLLNQQSDNFTNVPFRCRNTMSNCTPSYSSSATYYHNRQVGVKAKSYLASARKAAKIFVVFLSIARQLLMYFLQISNDASLREGLLTYSTLILLTVAKLKSTIYNLNLSSTVFSENLEYLI